MSQIITINIGGAGVKMGQAQLELFTKEHGISTDGFIERDTGTDINHLPLFRENSIGKWTPRSIFVDLEPDQIDNLVY